MIALKCAMSERKKSSAPTARDYVQDGIIAMWHGIENVGWGVHDATSTSWVDLINGFDRTIITNGEWTDKSLRSTSGVMNATQGQNSPNASLFWDAFNTGEAVTFEMVATSLSDSRPSPWETLFKGKITRYADGLLYNGSGLFSFANGTRFGIGTIHSVMIADSVGGRLIINGTQVATHSTPFSTNAYPRRDFYANQCVGEIFCSRVYNRALTDAEIAHNYAIDKAMFNIT